MNVADVAAQLREDERAARDVLERGCREDMLSLQRLLAGPLSKARRELPECILSTGSLDPTLRRSVLAQEAERIALRCAQRAFANADVRFRARFGMYAAALSDAHERFLKHPPRRISLPHLVLENESSIVPRCEVSLAAVDEWVKELAGTLRATLEAEVGRACRVTAERGLRSLARARIALRLEAHEAPIRLR